MNILSVILSENSLQTSYLGEATLQSVSFARNEKIYFIAPNAVSFVKDLQLSIEPIDSSDKNSAFWKLLDDSKSADDSFVHVIDHMGILLPHFYKAMAGTLQFVQADYAFCYALCIAPNSVVDVLKAPTAGNGTFVCSQILARKWVLDELRGSGDIVEVFVRLISEYRGLEVPCILAVVLD